MNQKRNSGDAAAAARRQSFNEMKPEAGIIGNMWNKYAYVGDTHLWKRETDTWPYRFTAGGHK